MKLRRSVKPVCRCPESGHVEPVAAVARHRDGIESCPLCAAHVASEHLADGRVRVPVHRRLSSVTVRAVGR